MNEGDQENISATTINEPYSNVQTDQDDNLNIMECEEHVQEGSKTAWTVDVQSIASKLSQM